MFSLASYQLFHSNPQTLVAALEVIGRYTSCIIRKTPYVLNTRIGWFQDTLAQNLVTPSYITVSQLDGNLRAGSDVYDRGGTVGWRPHCQGIALAGVEGGNAG